MRRALTVGYTAKLCVSHLGINFDNTLIENFTSKIEARLK